MRPNGTSETVTMSSSTQPTAAEIDPRRNRLEIIRFSSREARLQAFRAMVHRGQYELTATDPNVWSVPTDVVRVLLEENVPFEWITRNLP
jgi:hypothetical protein